MADDPKRKLWIAMCLTCMFMLVEVVGGIWAGSLALLGDAAHMCVASVDDNVNPSRVDLRRVSDRHEPRLATRASPECDK